LTFFSTIFIVNAINITDGLDGLAGGTCACVLVVFAVATLLNHTYIATTILGVCVAILGGFMFYNVNPAKVFMGDSGAFALGGIIAGTLYLLNMRIGIVIPFLIIFLLFIVELCSSGLQMSRKKFFKRKLFPIAPFHHYLEYKGMKEYTIVMCLWLIQGILAIIAILILFIQYSMLR
jgi:phospho-N-acetylmuramoyl-pentapeptide-transferase